MDQNGFVWILKYIGTPSVFVAGLVTVLTHKSWMPSAKQAARWLRSIRTVDDAIGRANRRWNNPVVVNILRDPADPDLRDVLELYNRRIPDGERCEEADMVRWLREDAARRKALKDPPLTDWYLVAKYGPRICGMVVFHYSLPSGLALVAYLATDPIPKLPMTEVSAMLIGKINSLVQNRRELRGFKGFVMEVDDPRHASTKRERTERLARIRRFRTLAEMAGLTLIAFDCDYMQPRLSSDVHEAERPMLLLSARSRGPGISVPSNRAEAIECLRFVYTEVYPDGFSVDPVESAQYQQYCSALLDRELNALPDPLLPLPFNRLSPAPQTRLEAKPQEK